MNAKSLGANDAAEGESPQKDSPLAGWWTDRKRYPEVSGIKRRVTDVGSSGMFS